MLFIKKGLYMNCLLSQGLRKIRQPLMTMVKRGATFTVAVLCALSLFSHALAATVGHSDLLMQAAHQGDAQRVRQLVQSGTDVNATNQNYESALLHATYKGHKEVVRVLLEDGAAVQHASRHGDTALHYAAISGHVDMVRLLLAYGANANVRNVSGASPLDFAKRYNHPQVVALLQQSQDGVDYAFKTAGDHHPIRFRSKEVYRDGAGAGWLGTAALLAAGVGGLAAGIGSLGGGGGGGAVGASSASVNYATAEFYGTDSAQTKNNMSFENIGVIEAYKRGLTGKGSTVAILDAGGFDLDHPDGQLGSFQANELDSSGNYIAEDFNLVDGAARQAPWYTQNPDLTPVAGASIGTHVAGVVAAKKDNFEMHGIAHGADLVAIKTDASRKTDALNLLNSSKVSSLHDKARATNIVLHTESSQGATVDGSFIQAMIDTMNKGIVHVFAAGSGGLSNEALMAFNDDGRNAAENQLLDTHSVLVVPGQTDADGNVTGLMSGSNTCGNAKMYCITAPGSGIYSTTPGVDSLNNADGTYGVLGGSDVAAAVTTSVISLLAEYDSLSTKEALAIIFASADRRYTAAEQAIVDDVSDTTLQQGDVSDTFGWGVINLANALNLTPTEFRVPVATDSATGYFGLVGSSIVTTDTFGDGLVKVGTLSFAVLDEYGRNFTKSFADVTETTSSAFDTEARLAAFGEAKVVPTKVDVVEGVSFAFSPDTTVDEASGEQELNVGEMSFSADMGGVTAVLGYNAAVQDHVGFAASLGYDDNVNVHPNTGKSSFLAYGKRGSQVAVGFDVDKNTKATFAAYHHEHDASRADDAPTSTGFVAQMTSNVRDDLTVTAHAGMVSEKSTFLGSTATGAFGVEENTPTWFYGLGAQYRAADDIAFQVTFQEGYTRPQAAGSSLISDFSTIRTQAFSAGVTMDDVVSKHDTVGFRVSQPLRVESGSMSVALPVHISRDKDVLFSGHTLNLEPTGREIDVEAHYAIDLADETSIKAGALYRHEPGHVKDADAEGVFLMKLKHKF